MKRTALAAALAALLAGTAYAGDTEVIIYKSENFRGPSYVVDGEVANLERGFARSGQSLVVKGGFWEVCTDDHFRGNCYVLEPGEYPSLSDRLHERIVSVRFAGTDEAKVARRVAREERRGLREEIREARREAREGIREARRDLREGIREARREARGGDWERHAAIDLYGRPDFRGRAVRIENNVRDLSERNFEGRASSAVVHEGAWQVCTRPYFEGRCEVLREGQYPHLAVLDDRIASVRPIR